MPTLTPLSTTPGRFSAVLWQSHGSSCWGLLVQCNKWFVPGWSGVAVLHLVRQVLDAVVLRPDLDTWCDEDLTDIGERGINLSGLVGRRSHVTWLYFMLCYKNTTPNCGGRSRSFVMTHEPFEGFQLFFCVLLLNGSLEIGRQRLFQLSLTHALFRQPSAVLRQPTDGRPIETSPRDETCHEQTAKRTHRASTTEHEQNRHE